MKLQTKLLLVMVPLIVGPLFALGWIAHTQLRDASIANTHRLLKTSINELGDKAASILTGSEANIGLFSKSSVLRDYLTSTDAIDRTTRLRPSLLELFAEYQEAYPAYFEIRILLPDGTEDTRVAIGNRMNVSENEAHMPYFEGMTQSANALFSTVFRNPDDNMTAWLISKRLMLLDPNKDPAIAAPYLRGYLVMTVDLAPLERALAQTHVGDDGELLLTNGDGKILFASPAGQGESVIPSTLFQQLVQSAKRGEPVSVYADVGTTHYLARAVHPDLMLVASRQETGLLAAGKGLSSSIAVIVILTIVITTALFVAVLRFLLVKPIQTLGRATQEISNGRIPVPVPINSQDEIGELARSFNDMARTLRQSSDQVNYLAYHDNLTGLPNRLMLGDSLGHAIAAARRDQTALALLFLDLDNFKPVNDTLGHHAGDDLLREVAKRLGGCIREDDYIACGPSVLGIGAEQPAELVARLGGDEFLMLLAGPHQDNYAERAAERILEALAKPFHVGRNELFVSASIGIAQFPGDGTDIDTLMRNADVAMYHAKQRGKNSYQYFSDSMNAAAARRLQMATKLRKALEQDKLLLYYHPHIDIATGRIVGCEALLRWLDPEFGWVAPATFVPVAQEAGLIIPLNKWVLREACRQNKRWQSAGISDLFVSVNVSAIHVNRTNLDRIVSDVLDETGLESRYLDIELTETSVMTARDEGLPVLENLRSLGVTVALDDFGTGYSSLSHLQRLCIDKLKIDRSFLHDIPGNRDNAAIVSAVIAMTRRLKLTVAAEGVETEEQLNFLRAEGCDLAQGFLFSRPLSPLAVERLLVEKDAPIGAGSVDWSIAAAGSQRTSAPSESWHREAANRYGVR